MAAPRICVDNLGSPIWDYVAISIAIPCILLVLVLLIKSIREIPKLKKIQTKIKIQYYINCAFSLLCMISGALFQFVCTNWIDSMVIICYWILVGGILNTLLLRLNHTFKESVYKLSSFQSWTINITKYILLIIGIISYCLYNIFQFTDIPITYTSLLIMVTSGAFIYLLLTGYALYLFANKLMILAHSRAASMRNVADENAIKLSQTQTKLINQTSRIVSLISIAMLTTFINAFMFTNSNHASIILLTLTYIDCTVNVICLYLTYPFSTKYYDRFCGCFNKCWNHILSRSAKNKMERKYRDHQNNITPVKSVETNE